MKVCHLAKMIDKNGNVSPLCASTPRKINLAKESWTIRDDAVTCKKCLSAMTISKPSVTENQGA